MITSMHIENFKCFKNFDIELGPFNVLIGPNDSGKTALFQAIRLAKAVGGQNIIDPVPISLFKDEDEILEELGPIKSWYWRGEKNGKISIAIKASAMDAPGDRRACAVVVYNNKISGDPTALSPRVGQREPNTPGGPNSKDWQTYAIGRVDYVQLDARALRRPTRSTEKFAHNGEGLPALIDDMRGDIDKFKSFQEEFCERFPYYKRIDRKFTVEGKTDLVGIEFVTRYDNRIPAVGVSDGVMLSLAFLALKYTSKIASHHVFLIEEPENGVHYGSLKKIVDSLRNLSKEKKIQVILTTHSPYLLDLVEPEEVRVFTKDDEGAVYARKMSDYPEVERLKKHFMTGEIWTEFSEEQIVLGKNGEK
ncbi:MAG TPA: hypothetical protein ENH84_04150 [Phycisphaerae bacterium]|nr:hypothetical protein [Phycisphaerae bacterium]